MKLLSIVFSFMSKGKCITILVPCLQYLLFSEINWDWNITLKYMQNFCFQTLSFWGKCLISIFGYHWRGSFIFVKYWSGLIRDCYSCMCLKVMMQYDIFRHHCMKRCFFNWNLVFSNSIVNLRKVITWSSNITLTLRI